VCYRYIEQTAVPTRDVSDLSLENHITTWTIARVLYNVRQRAPWFPDFERPLQIINEVSVAARRGESRGGGRPVKMGERPKMFAPSDVYYFFRKIFYLLSQIFRRGTN
jgi:hypothetical protein